MASFKKYNTPHEFENLYKVLSSTRFLNKEGLRGELPFFIHSFPVAKLTEIETHIQSLFKRLINEGIEIVDINLYNISLDILKREQLFEQVLVKEQSLPKQRLMRILNGPLNIDNVIIPEINRLISLYPAKIVFLTGIGNIFPIIRSHTILNNVQTLVGDLPLVMFFPGTYNNTTLQLFDTIKDENYYRAHNLNDYSI